MGNQISWGPDVARRMLPGARFAARLPCISSRCPGLLGSDGLEGQQRDETWALWL